MLVEINLIPKKERRPFSILIPIMILSICAVVGVAIFFSMQYHQLNQEYSSVKQNLFMTQKFYSLEEQKIQKNTENQPSVQLKNAIKWAKSDCFSTVFMMDRLTNLLPTRGFILTFASQDDGTVKIQAQFDTNQDVAYFLKNLTNSKYIKKVSLLEVNTVVLQDGRNASMLNSLAIKRYDANFSILLNKTELIAATKEEGK